MYSAGQGLSVADIFDIFIIFFREKGSWHFMNHNCLVDIAFLWKKKKKTKQKKKKIKKKTWNNY